MRKLLVLLMVMVGSALGQQSTVTVNTADGTQYTTTCMVGSVATRCDIRDTTPSPWVGLKGRKEIITRNKFCKAQGLQVYQKGLRAVLTPECDAAWGKHKAEEETTSK